MATTLAAFKDQLGGSTATETTMSDCYQAIYTYVESWYYIRDYLYDQGVANATLDAIQELVIGDNAGSGALEQIFSELATIMTDYSTLDIS